MKQYKTLMVLPEEIESTANREARAGWNLKSLILENLDDGAIWRIIVVSERDQNKALSDPARLIMKQLARRCSSPAESAASGSSDEP
jgi:hypothetical protein